MITPVSSSSVKTFDNGPSNQIKVQDTYSVYNSLANFDQLKITPQISKSKKKLGEHISGELLIRIKPDLNPGNESSLFLSGVNLQLLEKLPAPKNGIKSASTDNLYRVNFDKRLPIENVIQQLEKNNNVIFAEPNFIIRIKDLPSKMLPNDLSKNLWALNNTGQNNGKNDADIDAPEAWAVMPATVKKPVIIAVIDTGVDYKHPDLKDNMWVNQGEIEGDRLDNDNNGYIDDIHGFDFAYDDGDPMDKYGHGTHVAGTIAAKGNNGQGTTGVNWNGSAQIMALKFMRDSGEGSTADAIKAIVYATNNGAQITNNSWGGGDYSQALKDAIDNSPLFIAAAGNDGRSNDQQEFYPASYDLTNIISVSASDRNDKMPEFSNYGKNSVHLSAPGDSIYSTIPNGKYETKSGTSMAVPHVSGVASMILNKYPEATPQQIKLRLMNGVDPLTDFTDKTISGGRLNANNSLK